MAFSKMTRNVIRRYSITMLAANKNMILSIINNVVVHIENEQSYYFSEFNLNCESTFLICYHVNLKISSSA